MERREKKKMACTECRKRKEKCAPVDRLDDCNSCKEHKRVCIYAPVGAQPTQITPIGVTPSPSTSPSSDDWQPSIAARTRSDPSSRAGSQTAVSYHGAPSAITSHEAYGHDTGTMPVKRMILPAQCSCNESFRCIEHDPQTPLLAHLMSDEQMMQNFEPYIPADSLV